MFLCLLPIAEIPGIFELFEGEKVWSLHQDKVLRDTSGGGEGKLWSHCEEEEGKESGEERASFVEEE